MIRKLVGGLLVWLKECELDYRWPDRHTPKPPPPVGEWVDTSKMATCFITKKDWNIMYPNDQYAEPFELPPTAERATSCIDFTCGGARDPGFPIAPSTKELSEPDERGR